MAKGQGTQLLDGTGSSHAIIAPAFRDIGGVFGKKGGEQLSHRARQKKGTHKESMSNSRGLLRKQTELRRKRRG